MAKNESSGRGGKRRMARWKRVLLVLGSLVAGLALVIGVLFTWLYTGAEVSTVGAVDFSDALAVPPLAASTVEADGTRVFDLRMQAGETEFTPGAKTPTWGFNGSYLGPTLRAAKGEKVRVKVANSLPEESTVHWHGMHLPAAMDGGPHQMVPAGGSWAPEWTVDQPASTLWYHPHPHGATETHVQRGLAGLFLLDDAESAALPLPKTYGVDDIPAIVQDVTFDGAKLDHGHKLMRNVGFLGDRTMVNGTLDPYVTVQDELVRLRLLNASTARVYTFGLDDGREFWQIATDGGLLEAPQKTSRLRLSPGERAEVVIRMQPGERRILRSYPLDAELDFWNQRFGGGDDSFDVMQLRAAPTLRPSAPLPESLVASTLPTGEDSVRSRFFELEMSGINGRKMDMSRVDETVTRGSAETWTLRNDDGMPHNFHVHDVQFRVLDINGAAPPPSSRGPKDTVFIPTGATVRIALRFDGPADPNTPYMYHCHLLYHEDKGMMGQFVVVGPGQPPGTPKLPPTSGSHRH
ncbi:multicopper oxidase domain-containing protein [Streptomyces sp. H27-H1]|uniref:multicopper oxidase family protein n=1 Tax=Streptomyces sp. H27-H1 TaxID=2996461 RepID=UPI00226F2D36|nr:multicopper oxidase domain-containing protein [Streptomyces sp. H27-H1]MCY0930378.1 multicopper oxidase domain-containing protein [Streptomyces sp. H27-H1]